jgi:hypothetical protein
MSKQTRRFGVTLLVVGCLGVPAWAGQAPAAGQGQRGGAPPAQGQGAGRGPAPSEIIAAKATGDAAAIVELEKKIEDAVVRGDVAFVDKVTPATFSFVHGDGWTTGGRPLMEDDKGAFLERVADKEYLVHDLDLVKLEMHGDVGITYGRYVSLYMPPGRTAANPGRLNAIWYERVWARRNGAWQWLSHRTVHGPNPSPAGVDPTAAGVTPVVSLIDTAAGGRAQRGAGGGGGTGGQRGAGGGQRAAGAAAPARPVPPAEILQIDQKIADAVVRGDVAYVDSVTPADFVMVHGDGWANGGRPLLTDTKQSMLRRVETKAYAALPFDSIKAEMHDDVAITYGRYLGNQVANPPERSWFAVWFERVYQKRNGKWIYLSHRTVHGPTYGPTRDSVSDK